MKLVTAKMDFFSCMSRFIFFSCFCTFFRLSLSAQQQFSISGTLSEKESGETLIGATVVIPAIAAGTTTNEYGFYSITLPGQDSLIVEFSYVGFQTLRRLVFMDRDIRLDIELSSGVKLEEVIVKTNAFEERLSSTEMGVETITTKQAKRIPLLFGESDILKALQLKPGMPSGSEGTSGLFVRGGSSDQNLIILDEAIVYNPNHLFGFFSTFNTDAVKDLKIYKGSFPAQYGGRLSSVIDVKLKEGNRKRFSGRGGIGLISSRLTLEGPIQKDKSSFIISGRRTYVDVLTRQINKANEAKEDFNPIPDYFFYDLNTKINYQFTEKDRLYLSGYFGRDVFGFATDFFDFDFDWGNATGTLRWNHLFNPKLFANTTFTYSDYQYNIRNKISGFSFELGSKIVDTNLKSDFYYVLNRQHIFRFGGNITYHKFQVGRLKAGSDDGEVNFSSGRDFDGFEYGFYASDDFVLSEKFKLNAGLRLSGFFDNGVNYFGLEPRLALRFRLNDRLSLKAGYAKMFQYLHLVASAGVTLPTDIWYPSTARVAPQSSNQWTVGLTRLLGQHFLFTFESYFKRLDNQLEFVDGAQLFANDDLEEEFAIGKGRAYGIEISIEKKEGRLNGWIGYTLARIEKGEFKTIDENGNFLQQEYFSPIYDRRHDLSLVVMYELSRRFSANLTFVYGSGDLRWLPSGRFSFQDVEGLNFESVVPDYLDRNNYRLPPYHRLDLSLIISFFPKWGKSDLTINVVNVYDRRNTYFIFFQPKFRTVDTGQAVFEVPDRVVARQVSLFPVLPSLSWNFKF